MPNHSEILEDGKMIPHPIMPFRFMKPKLSPKKIQNSLIASLGVPPSLISEPEGRPTGERAAPERYNPETGTSYHQKVACHNIICQEEPEERTLEYTEDESKVVANIIVGLMRKCHMQQMIMQKGIKAFAPDGEPAAKEELRQMHSRTCF